MQGIVPVLAVLYGLPAAFPLAEGPWPAGNVKLPDSRCVPLDGEWWFVPDPECRLTAASVTAAQCRRIRVPGCWEAQFEDLVHYDGVAWYWRRFDIPSEWLEAAGRIFLRFDAVDYAAQVWLNGKLLGRHEGGYTPFEFDVTSALRPAGNLLVVRVVDPGTDRQRCDGLHIAEVPNGKQSHYCNIGGIWQSVCLRLRGSTYVHSLFVVPRGGKKADVVACVDGSLQSCRVDGLAVGNGAVFLNVENGSHGISSCDGWDKREDQAETDAAES